MSKFDKRAYSFPFLSNYYCNTRTFSTLNSFSEKVLNWLDLKTSPFSLWFVLEKIAFKGFERNKKEGWGGKKAHWFFFALFGAMKEGDLMEWKSLQNTQQSFLFCLHARSRDLEHEQISIRYLSRFFDCWAHGTTYAYTVRAPL